MRVLSEDIFVSFEVYECATLTLEMWFCQSQVSPSTPTNSSFRSDLTDYSASQLLSRGNDCVVNQVYYPSMKERTGSCWKMLNQNLSDVA